MGVPAHVHNDLHHCGAPNYDPDYYEMWMGGYSNEPAGSCEDPPSSSFTYPAQSWDRYTAASQGGLISEIFSMNDNDAIRYLFYNVNQLADHYPSSDQHQGDNNDWSNLDFLRDRYNSLGNSPSWDINLVNPIANECFDYSIRAIATLFYWFTLKTKQVEVNVKSTTGPIVAYIYPPMENPNTTSAFLDMILTTLFK